LEAILSVERLQAGYRGLNILWDVDIEVKEREVVSVIGPNGAGKTTLLKAIFGLIESKEGEIKFNGVRINDLKPHKRVDIGLTYVPSERELFPELTVEENLELGAYTKRARNNKDNLLEQVFEFFPRLKERKDQLAGTLSGGEQQMLAIARALMSAPRLLLLDEPSTGLAPIVTLSIYEKLKELTSELSILIAEQNVHQAFAISDRIYILENGRTVASGKPSELSEDSLIKSAYFGVSE
jgi:branched-chain amino acid transport system ATP-binding protein